MLRGQLCANNLKIFKQRDLLQKPLNQSVPEKIEKSIVHLDDRDQINRAVKRDIARALISNPFTLIPAESPERERESGVAMLSHALSISYRGSRKDGEGAHPPHSR